MLLVEIDDETLTRLLYVAYSDGWDEGWTVSDEDNRHWPTEEQNVEMKQYAEHRAAFAVKRLHNRSIADGFGSTWKKCPRLDCGLGVTRPGEADCYGYFPCALEETTCTT